MSRGQGQDIHTRDRFDSPGYRRALGAYPTGVTVVTARLPDGRRIGLTANSFTSVSLDPPLISWCPSKNASRLPELGEAAYFAVNVLAAHQHHFADRFATPTRKMVDKFAGVPLSEGIGGVPLLEGAVARFQCRTVRQFDAGDHVIFLGQVERYEAEGGEPLVFHAGRYRVPGQHPVA